MRTEAISDADMSPNEVKTTGSRWEEEIETKSVSFRRQLRRWLWHVHARQLMLLFVIAVRIAGWIGRRRRPISAEGCDIVLTGRFDSENWISAFLGPLSTAKGCARLWMVSTNSVPAMPNIHAIYPPKWLIRVLGSTPARLMTFLWVATRKRPHVVAGFHIMINGIMAAVVGRLVGARSMYFCVGGPAEISDGGIHGVEGYFMGMETADVVVEKRLLSIVSKLDTVITMGSRAVDFFRDKGVKTDFHIVPGGVDTKRFFSAETAPVADLVITGRIVPVKRIDVFLHALKEVLDKLPDVKAAIVGRGESQDRLQQLAMDLGLDSNVSFLGYQEDLVGWLHKSRIFVLTSDSEGLSLSMTEAMMCGLPAVVSDVGDLGDLVEDGVNGYLVPRRSPEKFAARIIELLTDAEKLKSFSQAARRSALRHTVEAASARWDDILKHYQNS